MIATLLLAQLAVAQDSTYVTLALERLIKRAVIENHAPPPSFGGYHARVETELSLILRDTLGRENAAQIEQLASAAHWTRGGTYDMHVLGYRSQGAGVPYSTLSFVRGWTEPSLYGERLRLGAQIGELRDSTHRVAPRDSIIAVHPFASDREGFYQYSGGDTIAVLKSGARTITIVRIHATPRFRDSTRFAAFDGDIQLDAERAQIVRMRGQFVVRGPAPRQRALINRLPGVVGVAFSEFVNAEVNGKYWLPSMQRTEFQSSIALLGRSRAVMRIVSDFSEYSIDDAGPIAPNDARRIAHVTTWAPSDSVSRFSDWHEAIGVATTSVSADDFDDIAPDVWRTTGGARFDLFPAKPENLVGYDRVGGFYTGIEGRLRMRDAFPGLAVGARVGWAWSEKTVRGGANASLQRGASVYGVLAERTLATTNDFIRTLDSESGGIAAFLASIDDHDYVDRRRALASFTQVIGSFDNAFVVAQLGVGSDRAEVARLTHGLSATPVFRPNRGAASGTYSLASADIEVHPSVSGDFVQPGIGGRLHAEAGRGALRWQRAEVSLDVRQYAGPVTLAAHVNGGAVFGASIPPQQLFEIGGSGTLPGYDFKEFVGDRAALFRSYVSYTLPLWRTPHRVVSSLFVPGLAPGFALGLSGGWTRLASVPASASAVQLGVPVRATEGVRATFGAGPTFFGGNLHLGIARPVDHASPWKFVIGLGTEF